MATATDNNNKSSSSSSSSSSFVVVVAVAAVTTTVVAVVVSIGTWYHVRVVRSISKNWEDRRNEERKGRIRAEVKLRTSLKQLQQLQQQQQQQQQKQQQDKNNISVDKENGTTTTTTTTPTPNQTNHNQQQQQQQQHSMLLKCIGTVVSPYTKRAGTPRQGALVPSSRGYINVSTVPIELFCGIEQYSHVWIVFGFHANTDLITSTKTKIRPPRAPPGVKVGQLATRSPHRPNPIGLSLVRLEYLDRIRRQVHVSGLDLVHGTPVYDIKPFVPWDIPGYYHDNNNNNNNNQVDSTSINHSNDKSQRLQPPPIQEMLSSETNVTVDSNSHKESKLTTNTTTTTTTTFRMPSDIVVFNIPDWVGRNDDALSHVVFTSHALTQLQYVVQQGRLAPLYTIDNDGVEAARQTMMQVLAQDPRSSHRGLKTTHQQRRSAVGSANTRNGGASTVTTTTTTTTPLASSISNSALSSSTSSLSTPYRLYFGSTGVDFVVQPESGVVQVLDVLPVDFPPDSYMDGIPLASFMS